MGTELKAETAKSLSRNDALNIGLCRRLVKVLVREAKQICRRIHGHDAMAWIAYDRAGGKRRVDPWIYAPEELISETRRFGGGCFGSALDISGSGMCGITAAKSGGSFANASSAEGSHCAHRSRYSLLTMPDRPFYGGDDRLERLLATAVIAANAKLNRVQDEIPLR